MPKIITDCVILCDDIRFETSNKVVLVGVYGAQVTTDQFPAQIRFWLYFKMNIVRLGDWSVEIQLRKGPRVLQAIVGKLTARFPSKEWLPVAMGPTNFEEAGIYEFWHKSESGRWVKIHSFEIVQVQRT